MTTIDFFFDFVSPYSYLANTQIAVFERKHSVKIVRRPVLLGAIFQATGNQAPALVAAKAKYMGDELPRLAAYFDVPIKWPQAFPPKSIPLLRAALAVRAKAPAAFEKFVDSAFVACWAEAKDPAEVLGDIGAAAGAPKELVLTANAQQEYKDALRTETEAAVKAGCFGVPTFALAHENFFGVESLPQLAARVQRGSPFPQFDTQPTFF